MWKTSLGEAERFTCISYVVGLTSYVIFTLLVIYFTLLVLYNTLLVQYAMSFVPHFTVLAGKYYTVCCRQ